MFEEIIVHIGSHKTGSTSIQEYLHNFQNKLGDADVFGFSDSGRRIGGNSCKLVQLTNQENSVEKALNLTSLKYLDQLKRRRVIISAESLFWLDSKDSIQELKNYINEISKRITILVYLRRQDACAISHKNQSAKNENRVSIWGDELTPLPSLENPEIHNYFDYNKKISMWGDVFGDRNVRIRVFEKTELIEGDVVSDFLNCCGITRAELWHTEANVSLSAKHQAFLHEINPFFKDNENARKILVQQVQKRSAMEAEAFDDKFLPSRKSAYEFYSKFRDGNLMLNQRFKISPREYIFDEDFSKYPDAEKYIDLDRQSLIEIFSESFKEASSIVTADFLRQTSLELESSNIVIAKKLMEKALQLRPHSQFMKQKVFEYQRKIDEMKKYA